MTGLTHSQQPGATVTADWSPSRAQSEALIRLSEFPDAL